MPCAAPCVRLPCNKRCSRNLSCGHQCPGICGEICPDDFCHACGVKGDVRVDFLEMKTYEEINPDESPIIALGCGHFFTAESLDGLVGIEEVYVTDKTGDFIGLKDVSAEMARSIPCCPDCRSPVRQHATHRYNRVVNRAVIDEMSKRFHVDGQQQLRALEHRVEKLGQSLETRQSKITTAIYQIRSDLTGLANRGKSKEINKDLQTREVQCAELRKAIESFCTKVDDKNQPRKKLHDATVHAVRSSSLNDLMANLTVHNAVPISSPDHRITFGGRLVKIKTEHLILEDSMALVQALRQAAPNTSIKMPNGDIEQLAKTFFASCKSLITGCVLENLPKLAVEVILSYAKVAHSWESFCQLSKNCIEEASENVKFAKELLEEAKELCKLEFGSADILRAFVEDLIKLLRKSWYEAVTPEEIAAIKAAMVSGSSGIATHSGHWYNCANGHPVSP